MAIGRPIRTPGCCFSGAGRRIKSVATTEGGVKVAPINIPEEWDDNGLLMFEDFCELIRTPQRTVRDWRQRGVGPRWTRFQGVGRLYITVAEARRFLASATITPVEAR